MQTTTLANTAQMIVASSHGFLKTCPAGCTDTQILLRSGNAAIQTRMQYHKHIYQRQYEG